MTTTNLNVNNIGADTLNDNIKKAIMDITYPVNSIFITRTLYTLTSGKNTSSETPLKYGTWELVNYYGVLGCATTTTQQNASRDNKILINQLPPHAHKVYHQGYFTCGSGSKTPASNVIIEDDNITYNGYTDMTLYKTNISGKNFNVSTVDNQQDYHPYGYYCFVYRKTAL